MNNPPKLKSAVLEINNPKVTSVHFTLNDAAMIYDDLMGEADVELSELCKKENPLNRVAIYNKGQLVAGILIEPKLEVALGKQAWTPSDDSDSSENHDNIEIIKP
jgi:hypothetical protein